ncbi:disease resistance protein RPS6-like [Capsella rubella]|uniref:disease resistance protein RPS6-like n=1 Tax=Capsella rubella TaxID=81985 RepID=UPI000CD50B81|nr:disease resistance protein RPS6-like [Capsella rubella]
MSSSSSLYRNWRYDVFPSFRGEDVRQTFLSHFLKELDRKLISVFKDMEMEKSQSLSPVLEQAIKDSRIAVVVLSQKYASSSWCLNELLKIMYCKEKLGQLVIPVFHDLDPSHVRKQTGDFGKFFEETCHNKTEHVIGSWRQALTDVANLGGFHSQNWENEAKLVEDIITDILRKLNVTPSKDFENFVGIEDHIAEMSSILALESMEVRMVGIWGTSGIGKTTIARVLYNQISRHFQGRIYIDRGFISKSKEDYIKGNPIDYNMRLHLQQSFLSELLNIEGIKVDHLGAVREKLNHMKVVVFIDDLDDQVVLDALAGRDEWFGPGSRIIVITKDKRLLEAHGIDYIYRVGLPSEKQALEMFCRSAFEQKSPPDGFMELTTEVAARAGGLPLGLEILGKVMKRRNKEDWMDMLSRLRKTLNGDIEKTLRVSYDDIDSREDKAIFRHIACFFNRVEINRFKSMLADSELDVSLGLTNLVNKSLISVKPLGSINIADMHCLVEQMGKEIVCAQSDEPGQREFLINSKDVCSVLEDNTGTKNVLGISLDMNEIDELRIDEKAFKGMPNLRFLRIFSGSWDREKEVELELPERFDYFPRKLKLLSWPRYPMKHMPTNFRPGSLVELRMPNIMILEKLWEGVKPLTCLKVMDLRGSKTLKEIPDLSKATNLETLDLCGCSSLVEVSSIQYLNKLKKLDMSGCSNVKTLPTLVNLQSLNSLDLSKCSELMIFPDVTTNIVCLNLDETAIEEFPYNLCLKKLDNLSMLKIKSGKLWEREQPLRPLMAMLSPTLTRLHLSDIPSLVELPSSIGSFTKLDQLTIRDCINLEILPTGINFQSLYILDLRGCSRLRTFPNISTNISYLFLARTGINEVPRWIENFSKLENLNMESCKNLIRVSLNIFKLKHVMVNFSDCWALGEASWINDSPSDDFLSKFPVPHEAFSSLPDNYLKNIGFNFTCLNLDPEAILHQPSIAFNTLKMSGEEVPSYFTHRTTGTCTSLTNIPLLATHLSQPFFRYRVCAVAIFDTPVPKFGVNGLYIHVTCRFKDRFGNSVDSCCLLHHFATTKKDSHLFIFDCRIPLNKDDVQLGQLSHNFVDVKIHVSNHRESTPILKGWGVRLLEDWSSAENQLGNSDTLPHVCEADEDSIVNHQTEDDEESVDSSNVETETSRKRMRIT